MTTAAAPRAVAAPSVATARGAVGSPAAVARRAAPAAATVVLAGVLRVVLGLPQTGYDAWWSLLWGRSLAHGSLPDLSGAFAPTPHPLAIGVAAVVGNATALAWLSLLALAACGVVVAVLGGRLFGPVAGALAAAILLTRPLLAGSVLESGTDVPFLALVLGAGAALVHPDGARYRRALILLTAAGLLRPEAWALAVVVAAIAPSRRRFALALAAPAAWLLFDLVCTGDPLHSLHGTRDLADALGRAHSFGAALRLGPDYLTVVLGDAVALLGGAAAIAALWIAPRRALLPLATLGAGAAAFLALGIAGLPLLYRYTLLPSAALALLAAWAPTAFAAASRGTALRAALIAGAVAAVAALALNAPHAASGLRDQARFAGTALREQRDLTALVRSPAVRARLRGCAAAAPVLLAQQRPVPQVAFLLAQDRPIRVGGSAPARGVILTPRRGSLAFTDHLAPTDAPAPDPRAVNSARPLDTRGAWAALSTC
ncbi:hypothetical protein [Conexibacter woesei]|uniref:hypothetical protein n=1 Tax=Conexibacter woesei TaxID=191495 RepID=UPI00042A7561|nr:hypothetical protein [Conexibacter woesei]